MNRNRPPRRILRDDLIVELSKRGKSDIKQIRAIRGIERSVSKKHLETLSEVIERALQVPKDQRPRSLKPPASQQANLLGQFLSAGLAIVCRSLNLAPSIVGTVQDVRDLVTFKLFPNQFENEPAPALAAGWRSEVVGKQIEDLLAGRSAIRIQDANSREPLVIERIDQN